jgi:hypothetical protein
MGLCEKGVDVTESTESVGADTESPKHENDVLPKLDRRLVEGLDSVTSYIL